MQTSLDDKTFYSTFLAPKFDHNTLLFTNIPSHIYCTDYVESVGSNLEDIFYYPPDLTKLKKK